jgi:hypothetical protein
MPSPNAGTGIDVYGSNNTIINSQTAGRTAGIAIESGANGNVVANNYIVDGIGDGIDNIAATGTAITNNTVTDTCGTGIRVSGTSSKVSVQNNVVIYSGASFNQQCTRPGTAVEIGLYGAATRSTVVDYNTTCHEGTGAYALNTPMDLAAFRKASRQATHDIASAYMSDVVDNANSAAPGFQRTDLSGNTRTDLAAFPNTGAGPITYADRGFFEYSN